MLAIFILNGLLTEYFQQNIGSDFLFPSYLFTGDIPFGDL